MSRRRWKRAITASVGPAKQRIPQPPKSSIVEGSTFVFAEEVCLEMLEHGYVSTKLGIVRAKNLKIWELDLQSIFV